MIGRRGLPGIGLIFCITAICPFGAEAVAQNIAHTNTKIVSAKLFMETTGSKSNDAAIFLNGVEIGKMPVAGNSWVRCAPINIAASGLAAIATINSISVENPSKGLFKIKNVYLEVRDKKGNTIKSDIHEQVISSYETSNFSGGWAVRGPSRFQGKPLAVFALTLPSAPLGYIKQPVFHYTNRSVVEDHRGREWWKRVEAASLRDTNKRTCLVSRIHILAQTPCEYIVDQLKRYNTNSISVSYSEQCELPKLVEKLQWLRKQGYLLGMHFGIRNSAETRIAGTKAHKAFLAMVAKSARQFDIIGADEWFLAPILSKTQGGTITNLDPAFLNAFREFSGYSNEDTVWAFKNWKSSDPRAIKAWQFCEKVQNDLAREFVRVCKKSNPEIKTWVSYIGHNWNKLVTCIDRGVRDFDEILDCQTYWYGRFSDDSLNAPTVTAPIGLGKIMASEYPDKFLWMGIDPGYTGRKTPPDRINSWQRSTYYNSAEEVLPYIATLYASSDGVFVQNPFLSHMPDKGSTDEFADMIRLASKLVPRVKQQVKADVAYYYNPQATWEVIRQANRWWAPRETNRIAIGFIQQFFDVDVTSEVKDYKNVIVVGGLLPADLDYEKQNIYFIGAPEFNEKGEKLSAKELAKIGIAGFSKMGKNFKPADDLSYNENGCTDVFDLSGDIEVKKEVSHGWEIIGADLSLRKLSYAHDQEQKYTVGAQNKRGNIRVNSFWPSFLHQNTMRKILKKDFDYFGWTKRDCPQINGKTDVVAVAFRYQRTAVLEFGNDVLYSKVRIVMFNGRDGVTRDETIKYRKGMKIEVPPLNVLVARAIEGK